MAQSNSEIEKKDAARAKREQRTVKKSERLSSLRNSAGDDSFGWGVVDPRSIARLVAAVTQAGGAVMFSVTSDGGALGITFYDNGDRERVYIPKSADLEGEFEYLVGLWL